MYSSLNCKHITNLGITVGILLTTKRLKLELIASISLQVSFSKKINIFISRNKEKPLSPNSGK